MTPQTIINLSRYVMQDQADVAAVYRQADAELLVYVHDALRVISVMRPDLFSDVIAFACVAGQCEQAITFAQGQRVLDVLAITGGGAVRPTDRMTLDQFRPAWRSDPAGPAENWFPLEGDPRRFFIYPRAPSSQNLDLRLVRNPGTYAIGDTIIELPDALEPAMADYVIYRSESKDDENVLNERAAAHFASFKAKMGGA